MSGHFGLLSQVPLEAYVKRVAAAPGPWVFQHIPKTAGTSLVQELRFCFPPYRNINAAAGGADPQRRHAALVTALAEFLEGDAKGRARSLSGHLRLGQVNQIRAALPDARVFTFLRDPVARVVSEFRYTRTPKHPGHQEYLDRYPTVAAFAADEANRDRMWHFLAPPTLAADREGIEQLFRRFAFIGVTESLDACFEFLSSLDGHPKTPAGRANVTRAQADNDVALTPELEAEIRAANPRDVALYEAVAARLAAAADDMRRHVERRREQYAGRAPIA